MKILRRITGLVLALALITATFATTSFAAESKSSGGEYLQSVIDLIKQKYNGNISEDELINAALKGMFGDLDQYSSFYFPDELDSVYGPLEGAVEGVGIVVEQIDKDVVVQMVYQGSPAQKAGLLSGDKIVSVDGVSVAGKELEEVTSKVKGAAGTSVKIGIARQGVKNTITLQMSRANIDLPSVHYEVRGDIGYILIDSFSDNSSQGVIEALKYFDTKKITKVILDLRNNPGGYLDQAVDIAKQFVPKGLITKLDYKDPSMKDISYYSDLEKVKYRLAVLVNENSASASEILTGAIKDTKAGVIIGNKTFGKAKVQEAIPILSTEAYDKFNGTDEDKSVNALDFNSYENDVVGWAKMTIGLYYTPNGNCIDLKGIDPDIKVAQSNPKGITVNLVEPLTVTVKPSPGTRYYDVFSAECILKLLNYNVDTPDYILDSKTSEAIKKLQKDNNLSSSGTLDFTTQRLLNTKLADIKQNQDNVYSRAALELKR
jgi:carboxyl-terminal processing protease